MNAGPAAPRAARYAVYYVPADDSALGRFGAALFASWPDGRPAAAVSEHPERRARTADAARYGFHATLKAPMRLVAGIGEEALLEAVRALAAGFQPAPRCALALQHHEDVFALCPAPGESTERIDAIAERCVLDLERLRAPLDDAERARRRPERLPPAARDRFERFGYPWVLDGFRFHMTLARTVVDRAHRRPATAVAPDFERWLRELADEAIAEGLHLDRLAVARENAPGMAFRRIAEFRL